MNMNTTFFLKKELIETKWRVIDAEGKILGRLATQIADILRGKDKAIYTPHTISGDYVIILNADKVKMTGDKFEDKVIDSYSGWIGGYKVKKPKDTKPEELIELAVSRMLPKNKTNKHLMRRLKVYAGSEHPHAAQIK